MNRARLDEEVGAMLDAFAGPPHARQRHGGRRRVPRVSTAFAVLAVAAASSGAVATVVLTLGEERDSSVHRAVEFPLLEPGPNRVDARTSSAIERVTLQEMEATADVIFVGEVREISAAESVGGATIRTVRFDVDQVFRGGAADTIDIANFDDGEATFGVTVAQRYLVFAEPRPLGESRTVALVPVGYVQGVYRLETPTVATNDVNGRVDLESLEARLDP